MKKQVLLGLFLLITLSFTACQKGEIGPQGEKGEQGLKGADGSTMHSGTGAPANSLGNIGDFYLDKNTAELYGPKTNTSWPTPISLKGSTGATGATGAAGTPGSKILNGTTAPILSIGAEGDFYFDTANLAFYGPKTANSWGSAISLGASNTVTTFLYNNQIFDNVVLEYTGIYIPTTYEYSANKTLNITHASYLNAYNTGVIIIYSKFSNNTNSTWGLRQWHETLSYNNEGRHEEFGLFSQEDDLKSDKITIEGHQSTTEDPNGNGIKNIKFDVKVVCIPAGTVVQMSSKNIDIKDANAIAKYLGL